jgi:hypothetical protein
VQVATDSLFTAVIFDDSAVIDTVHTVAGLAPGVTYFWRVRAHNGAGDGPLSSFWRFSTEGEVTRSYPMEQFWNLVSLPQAVDNAWAGAVFPIASSTLYAFDAGTGYVPTDTLRPGVGYWVKFDSAVTVDITGVPVNADTVPVGAGWNLIGSIAQPLDTAAVVQIPAGILQTPFYLFDPESAYMPADTLRPARGYWVKSGHAGSLILRTVGVGTTSHKETASQRGRQESIR